MDTEQKIYQAMETVKNKEPLFTSIITQLVPHEDKSAGTMGTDGERLSYNPDFVNSLTSSELAACILHESLHCAFSHIWRREKRQAMLWNISADYAINEIVNETFPLPKGSLLDSQYYGMSAEMIYDLLNKTNKGKLKGQEWCDYDQWEGNGKGDGKGTKSKGKEKVKGKAGEAGKEGEGGEGESEETKNLFDKIKDKLFGESKEKQWEKELDRKYKDRQLQEEWQRLFKKTLLKNYGKLPDSIKRVLEKSYYIPVIDWSLLVKNILSEDTTDYSFSHPDRRFLEADFVLPGIYSIDKLENVVFCYDTSGSINDNDLFAFYLETLSLLDNFSSFKGWAAVCDADLHSFKEIDAKSTFNDSDFIGGGGTDFRPPFNEIEKRQLNPKAVFYFTDTYGEFPYKEPPYPVYWLVPSEIGNMDKREVPFGTVVNFLPKY